MCSFDTFAIRNLTYMKNKLLLLLLWGLTPVLNIHSQSYQTLRERLDLSGMWESSLGMCRLPGTTDENRLGGGNADTSVTYQLTRTHPYKGRVDYMREIHIPESFRGKRLFLVMERTKPSTLWIDGDSIGSFTHLYTPHRYELPPLLPGVHRLHLRIDNSDEAVPKEIHSSHAWTDATQTNWNGVLGEFYIESIPAIHIASVQVYPQLDKKQARVVAQVYAEEKRKALLEIEGHAWNTPETHRLKPVSLKHTLQRGVNEVALNLDMGDNPLLWSEFHPSLYKLHIKLKAGNEVDNHVVDFGMRKFETQGTQFVINGNKTFLRGTHNACVFPLTGYAPMDVETWQRFLQTIKQYGINHIRFHSYTPPKAAFQAADREGVYLQPELPLWGYIRRENKTLNDFLKREGDYLLEDLGNHASFTMLGLGNELDVEHDVVNEWITDFRSRDNRHLYSFGSNNNLGWKGPQEGEDFFVTCRVGGGEGYSTHVRTSFAYVDAEKGGILNNTRPSTVADYSAAIARCLRPVVGHETGQFQMYPDYSQLARYTGVLRPYNLEIFKKRLEDANLQNQAEAFREATVGFAAACYKADMEYAFRTPGFGGFQMLDLQDYPGQGTALVGILDAFMESKGITPEAFREYCSPLVPLALFEDYCLLNTQTFRASISVANYWESNWEKPLYWSVSATDGSWARQGELLVKAGQGSVDKVGEITLSLREIDVPKQLILTIFTGAYRNSYPLWVYPDEREEEGNIHIASHLDSNLQKALSDGATALLIPCHDSIREQSVGGMFIPDFWNYSMFKTISENAGKEVSPGTLSILAEPSHPLFNSFPTESHSNWQWWSVVRNSRPMILDATPAEYKPIVQVIDNIERNHKLGIVFEFAVGKGKLLVCTTNLQAIEGTPEGRNFRNSLLKYMKSEAFSPVSRLTWEQLTALLHSGISRRDITGVANESDYTKGNE